MCGFAYSLNATLKRCVRAAGVAPLDVGGRGGGIGAGGDGEKIELRMLVMLLHQASGRRVYADAGVSLLPGGGIVIGGIGGSAPQKVPHGPHLGSSPCLARAHPRAPPARGPHRVSPSSASSNAPP